MPMSTPLSELSGGTVVSMSILCVSVERPFGSFGFGDTGGGGNFRVGDLSICKR